MAFCKYLLLFVVGTSTYAAPASKEVNQQKVEDDLKTAGSSYSHQYSDWGGSTPGGYGFSVTGFGTIDDKYANSQGYKGFNGIDNSLQSGYTGYNRNIDIPNHGSSGYRTYASNNLGSGGYGPSGFETNGYGASGYGASGYGASGYGASGYGASGYGANNGYNGNGYSATGYGANGYGSGYTARGYNPSVGSVPNGFENIGNGGYGGFGGNGGLNSYYGYNNPNYVGGGHLGYGYYQKGNIYSNGVTPNLLTGYRGYSRR